jgi:hypothetical protein
MGNFSIHQRLCFNLQNTFLLCEVLRFLALEIIYVSSSKSETVFSELKPIQYSETFLSIVSSDCDDGYYIR